MPTLDDIFEEEQNALVKRHQDRLALEREVLKTAAGQRAARLRAEAADAALARHADAMEAEGAAHDDEENSDEDENND